MTKFLKEEEQLIKDVFIYMMDYINDDCFNEEDRKHFDNVYSKLSQSNILQFK